MWGRSRAAISSRQGEKQIRKGLSTGLHNDKYHDIGTAGTLDNWNKRLHTTKSQNCRVLRACPVAPSPTVDTTIPKNECDLERRATGRGAVVSPSTAPETATRPPHHARRGHRDSRAAQVRKNEPRADRRRHPLLHQPDQTGLQRPAPPQEARQVVQRQGARPQQLWYRRGWRGRGYHHRIDRGCRAQRARSLFGLSRIGNYHTDMLLQLASYFVMQSHHAQFYVPLMIHLFHPFYIVCLHPL
ncbi:hypothetical protein B0T25DRAFT_535626 [Lasiosphaeria hispida]|uniref:Uncharacterized protein n=1 Tax=Lasiosphaeria hispida TaxID=260671 RepID=A0AAJ0MIV5_9PEZI|nr:hypothetical protein B0T25DRAFT_535626 [Lasiosphaeria hispida]